MWVTGEGDLDRLRRIASCVLPGSWDGAEVSRGQFHDVVLLPGVGVVRVARRAAAAAQLRRRTALLDRLGSLGMPFAVPEPLSDPIEVEGCTAVALSWIRGRPLPRGEGDPARLASLLAVLADAELSSVGDLLNRPHAYAGGDRWYELMIGEAVPRLPVSLRAVARRRVDDAANLSPVEPRLVHGDLGGDNLRWDDSGHLLGVLDWDLAQPFDPAVDAACLAWHGWHNVRAAVGERTYRRARTWWKTFGIEQIVAAITNEEPDHIVDIYVHKAAQWLDRTRKADG